MGKILEPVDPGTTGAERENQIFEIRGQIQTRKEDHYNQLMTMCGGDVVQFEQLKHGSVGTYLTKLQNVVEKTTPKVDQSGIEHLQKSARKR